MKTDKQFILLIIANVLEDNIFYLLSLFGWLAYLLKPIRDDIKVIKERGESK